MTALQTAAEVAASIHADVSPRTVDDARRAGALASVKVGRRHYFTQDQVDAWLEAQSTTAQLLTSRSRRSIGRAS
jgi:hypothetical protein